MNSLNRVVFIGHIGADPESRATSTGATVALVSIATTSSRKSGTEWIESTDWHRLTAFEKNAEFLLRYAKKGGLLAVDCTVKPTSWTDAKGVKRYATNLVVQKIHHLGRPKPAPSFRPEGHVTDLPEPPDYGDDTPPPLTDDDFYEPESDGS